MNNINIGERLIRPNQPILCPGLYGSPRLTPTGKISHAKTRVYTQRYRKEWELMPDFRGWLTSVPGQVTRAYCTYCKKNLHAHRLSLLKHTCTMKHQRSALMHQNEANAQQASAVKIINLVDGYEQHSQVEYVRKEGDREESDDFEYVVESLEMEDDELDDSRGQEQGDLDNTENYEEEAQGAMDGHEQISMSRKIKMERDDDQHQDTLAVAMAHVHGDYLESPHEQVSAEMEMVADEVTDIHDTEHDPTIALMDDVVCETQNNDIEDDMKKTVINKSRTMEEEFGDGVVNESEISITPIRKASPGMEKSFKNLKEALASGKVLMSSTGGTTFGTPISVPTGQTKTIKLGSGKTVTLKPGTQYVLSSFKRDNIADFLLANNRKNALPADEPSAKSVSVAVSSQTSQKSNSGPTIVPGTSKQSLTQRNPLTGGMKKPPCISTHVLDTTKGLPIGGLQVSLYKLMDGRWTFLNECNTSPNGRCNDLLDTSKCNFTAGRYKLHFDVDKYFTLRRIEALFPFIEIVFDVKNPTGNYHIPILLSPFGYTTYRDSSR